MVKKWISLINYGAGAAIALLLLFAAYFYLASQTSFPTNDTIARKTVLPKCAFERAAEEYERISSPALSLEYSPLSVQLPDLRRHLIYYGKNGRPDAKDEKLAPLYFTFTGNKSPSPILPGERRYILYDKQQTPNQYVFSPDNAPTPIWIEATAQGNQAIVKVRMNGENGQIISEPAAYGQFSLQEKEFVRFGGTVWELGKWRVDGTILARQRARWFGIDKFLEKHGGPEYQDMVAKQRIDFGENDEAYSVYVGLNDCLIWKENRWQSIRPGEDTLNYVLLCVKKIDERVMNLELWDIGGKGKVSLNLVKANEAWLPQNLEQSFKFVGARTRTQFVFEINKERMLVSPQDWLLLTESGWKKLSTPKDIDDYVERRKVGPLFVFDSVERKDDRQVIIGTLFNAPRTEMVTIELPLQQSSANPPGGKPGPNDKKQKSKESNPNPMVKPGGSQGDRGVQLRPPRSDQQMRGDVEEDDDDEDDQE